MSVTVGPTGISSGSIIPTSTISGNISQPTFFGNGSSIISNITSTVMSATSSISSTTTSASPSATSNGGFGSQYLDDYTNTAKNPASISTQFVICFAAGLIFFLAFCFFRTKVPVLFAPRNNMKRHKPPELPGSLFGWIIPLIKIDDEEMLNNVGLDALLLLKFVLMCIKIFGICCFFGLVVFIPINMTTGYNSVPNATAINQLSIASIEEGSSKFIAYLIFAYGFTFVSFFFLTKGYDEYIYLRAKFLLKQSKSMVSRSIIVTGIPSHLRSDQALSDYYENLDIGPVESCYVVREVHRLSTMIKKRANALMKLEEAYASYWGNPCKIPGYDPDRILDDVEMYKKILTLAEKRESTDDESSDEETKKSSGTPSSSLRRKKKKKPGNTTFFKGLVEPKFNLKKAKSRRPTVRVGGVFGLFGQKVDAIEYYTKLFDDLDKIVTERRRSPNYEMTNVAFVTFEHMSSAVIASQIAINPVPFNLRTSMAYEPRDVLWDSISIRGRERVVREAVSWTITVAIAVLWIFPVGGMTTLVKVDFIEKINPGIAARIRGSTVGTLIFSSILPTLILNIFTSVLPLIFDTMSYYQGLRSRSAVAESTFSKYYFFLIFFVLLVYSLADIIFSTLSNVIDLTSNLKDIPPFIAKKLADLSPFFVNYIILQAFLIMPLNLLLLGAIIIRGFWHLFICSTPREHAENRAPWAFNYGIGYPAPLLVFALVFEYSLINPLILLFGVVYFCITYVVYKYQFLYVYFRPYEAAGKFWLMIIPRVIFTLVLFQLTMMGIFMLNTSYVLGGLCVPLILITFLFQYMLNKAYKESSIHMPMQLLRDNLEKLPNGSDIEEYDDDDDDEEHSSCDEQNSNGASPTGDNKSRGNNVVAVEDTKAEEEKMIARNRWKSAAKSAVEEKKAEEERKAEEEKKAEEKLAARNRWKSAAKSAVNLKTEQIADPTSDSKSIIRPRHRKVILDEDDYEATPTRLTDYRQPPMQLNPGILDAGFKKYGNPLLVGVLPQLWLPVKVLGEGDTLHPDGRRRSDLLHNRISGGGNLAQHLAEILRKVETESKSQTDLKNNTAANKTAPVQAGNVDDDAEAALIKKSRVHAHNDAASIVEPHPKISVLRGLFKRGAIKQSNVPNSDTTAAQDFKLKHIQNTNDDATIDSIERGQHGVLSVQHTNSSGHLSATSGKTVHQVYYHHPERRRPRASSRISSRESSRDSSYDMLPPTLPQLEHRSSGLSAPALFPEAEDNEAIAESIIRPDTQNSRHSGAPLLKKKDEKHLA